MGQELGGYDAEVSSTVDASPIARLLAQGKVGVTTKSQASRSGMRAYATSKLCNLLTARSLATSTFSQPRGLRVIAFNPGTYSWNAVSCGIKRLR